MKIIYFLIIYLIINLFGFNECTLEEDIYTPIFNITGHMTRILKKISNETCYENDKISICYCLKDFEKYYLSNASELSADEMKDDLKKLYEGSSKGFIDISSYYNCFDYKDFENRRYNYYTIYPNLTREQRKDISSFNNKSEEYTWIFGVCLHRNLNCSETDLQLLFEKINIEFNNSFKDFNRNNVIVFNNTKFYHDIWNMKSFGFYLKSIPLLLYFVQLIFCIFTLIPKSLFGICIKKKYFQIKNYRISSMRVKMSRKITNKVYSCFSLCENFDELFSPKENSELFKDDDLTYIKGVKVIGIIFYIFGITFLYFFNYPICIDDAFQKQSYIKDLKTSILIFFLRFSPAILLSCSGYSLCYKFLNFLDKKLADVGSVKYERLQELKNNTQNPSESISYSMTSVNEKKSKAHNNPNETESFIENSIGIKFYENDLSTEQLKKMFNNQTVDDSIVLSKTSPRLIPIKALYNFLLRQIHKVFLIPLLLLFFKYSFPTICVKSNKGAPLINYLINGLINRIDNFGFGNFLFYKNFITLFTFNNEESNENISILHVAGILVCEANFFILGTVLIFFAYKKKIAFDNVLLIISVCLILLKIITTFICNFNTEAFFSDVRYEEIFLNPIFNLDYYLIGMFFGLVNYVIQNDLIKKESLIDKRPMVEIPVYLCKLCDYKKGKNICGVVFVVIFLIISIIIFPILYFHTSLNSEVLNIIIKFISIIDVDAFIILFNIFLLSCYLSGGNIIFRFFNSSIWNTVYKLYFQIIIIAPITSYVIIYKTETKLKLGAFIVAFYGFICALNILLISLFDFLLLELPYKKLIKIYFNIDKIKKEEDEEEEEEDKKDKKYAIEKNTINNLNENDINNNDKKNIKNDEEKDEEEEEKEKKVERENSQSEGEIKEI